MSDYCKPGSFSFPGAADCAKCDGERLAKLVEETGDWTQGFGGMIVCSVCGNKRCPKATFHGNECTGSNEPNQPGSSYQICKCEYENKFDLDALPSKYNPECTAHPDGETK